MLHGRRAQVGALPGSTAAMIEFGDEGAEFEFMLAEF
jgi:hypothetical protein